MRLTRIPLVTALALLTAVGPLEGTNTPERTSIGQKVPNFTLRDPHANKAVSLTEYQGRKAVVLCVLGTECPISNNSLLRLVELEKEYAAQGVQFLALYPNPQDHAERVAAHAKKFGITFPVLRDESQTVIEGLAARRVPEMFLLDAGRTVRYQGRLDDRFGIDYQRPKPTRHDLKEALDEVLAGKAVSQTVTPVAGCLITRKLTPKGETTVTYARHVSRIMQQNCQECHRPGQVAPCSLLTYDDVSAWSAMIREVVSEGRMPPWYADPAHGKFANDRSLSKQDRDTLLAWIDQGCPKGEDRDLPAPKEFPSEWMIGKPDAVFTMPKSFTVPAESPKNGIPYQYFTVDTNFTEDRWVAAAEARPGALPVVHHIIVFVVPPGQSFNPKMPGMRVLCGTAPGDMPFMAPAGMAKKVPAGSKLVFQMHYTASGREHADRSSVGLVFATGPVERQILTVPVGNPVLRIPAGAEHHQVESRFTFKEDAQLLTFMPHLHLRGKDFLYEVILPDGQKEVLLSIPRYNFNWQSVYRLTEPRKVPKGTVLHCVAHYDNSAKNPNNPDPTKEVRWGDQTWEEMMIGWVDFVYELKP